MRNIEKNEEVGRRHSKMELNQGYAANDIVMVVMKLHTIQNLHLIQGS